MNFCVINLFQVILFLVLNVLDLNFLPKFNNSIYIKLNFIELFSTYH